MIKSNHLRIGNWVNEEVLGYVIVSEINKDGAWLQGNNMRIDKVIEHCFYHISQRNILPILLNNDVLKACGSSQGHDTDMWRNPVGVWLTKVHNKEKFFVQGFRAGYTISFLHEYQNVVFALTGEELQVNW